MLWTVFRSAAQPHGHLIAADGADVQPVHINRCRDGIDAVRVGNVRQVRHHAEVFFIHLRERVLVPRSVTLSVEVTTVTSRSVVRFS